MGFIVVRRPWHLAVVGCPVGEDDAGAAAGESPADRRTYPPLSPYTSNERHPTTQVFRLWNHGWGLGQGLLRMGQFRGFVRSTVGALAERFVGFGRVHARGAQEINGRRPYLAYQHAGPEVASLFQNCGSPSRGLEGKPTGLDGMLGLLDVRAECLDGS